MKRIAPTVTRVIAFVVYPRDPGRELEKGENAV